MSVQLLVADIDGTLVRTDKALSDATVAAAARLRDAGVALALISARPGSGIAPLAKQLALEGVFGAFNGATIAKSDGTVVSAERLDDRVAARALELLAHPAIDLWLYADDRWYVTQTTNPHTAREKLSAGVDPTIVADLAPLARRVDKIVGVSEDHALLARLDPEIAAALGGKATIARSHAYFLDVTPPTGNKGDGIARIAEAAGVSLANTAAIGDGMNDIAMLKRAGLAVAMGNAPDEVKAAAGHVTRSNDDDGVAAAIDEIIIPARI